MFPRPLSVVRSLAAAIILTLALVRPAAAVDWTDLWWNPNEAGWGVNLVQSDNFMFATFFIYGSDNKPTWVTANMTQDANGVWSGPLYQTTGTFYGSPWSQGQQTTTQVGTATFTPTSSVTGTLTYNVGTTNVAKAIQRQTLTTIPLGGNYAGGLETIFSNCNSAGDNGTVDLFATLTVTQTAAGNLTLTFSAGGPLTIAGSYAQLGSLYSISNAAYSNSIFTGPTINSTAQVSQIKATAFGIEGTWVASVNSVYPGCIETSYFSAVFLR